MTVNKSSLVPFAMSSALTLCALPCETSLAQTQDVILAEVVVTAEKRAENLQNVPISVTALSSEDIRNRSVRRPEDLVGSVANLQTVAGVSGDNIPIFSLRGISMSDYSFAQNGPVATYYDEVYKGNFAIVGLGLFDIDRAEVLKGPQGTLYGKNTTGGAVNIISRKPSFATDANISFGVGNYEARYIEGGAETAFSNTLAGRIGFVYERADGWFENLAAGGPDLNSVRQHGLRGTLLFRPRDDLEFTLRATSTLQNPWNYGTASTPGPDGIGGSIYPEFGIPADFKTGIGRREIVAEPLRRHARTEAISLTIQAQIPKGLTLTSISSYDDGSLYTHEDGEGSELRLIDAIYFARTRQISQDLRLTSNFDGPFNFILGAYADKEDIFSYTDLTWASDLDVNMDGNYDAQDCIDGGGLLACQFGNRFDQEKKSLAAYFDANIDLRENLKARAGLRYTKDRAALSNFSAQMRGSDGTPLINLIPGDPGIIDAVTGRRVSDTDLSGKVGLDYQLTPEAMVYGTVSRGYRGASFNASAFYGPGELTTARPETLTAVEVGLKSELLDRRLRLNSAVFWYQYKNQQFLDVDPETILQVLVNLPKSRIIGGEIELQALLTDRVTLSSNVGVLDTEVQRGTSQGVDISGNDLINAPKLSLTAALDWQALSTDWGGVDVNLDVAYASSQYFAIDNNPIAREDSRTTLNGRIRIHNRDDRYGISFWMKNITDTYYRTTAIDVTGGLGFVWAQANRPRTYGLTVDMRL